MKFFLKYPGARTLYRVGERTFLEHQLTEADAYAAQTGQRVRKVKRPANKADDGTE